MFEFRIFANFYLLKSKNIKNISPNLEKYFTSSDPHHDISKQPR